MGAGKRQAHTPATNENVGHTLRFRLVCPTRREGYFVEVIESWPLVAAATTAAVVGSSDSSGAALEFLIARLDRFVELFRAVRLC